MNSNSVHLVGSGRVQISVCLLWFALSSAPAWAQTDAIEAGERALRETGQPWYDPTSDGIRPFVVDDTKVAERKDWRGLERPDWNWNWNVGAPNLSWLGELFKILAWIVLIGLLALLIYALVKSFLNMEASLASSTQHVSGEADGVSDVQRIDNLPIPLRQRQGDLLAIAKRYYESGDFGEAIVYLFSHRLLQLDKAGLIRLAKGKTNRQYLSEIRKSGELRRIFGQTIVTFEDVFFGNHSLSRDRFERCWRLNSDFQLNIQEAMS